MRLSVRKGAGRSIRLRAIAACAFVILLGCAGARQLAALHQVRFRYAGIADPRLAGIRLADVHSPDDLNAVDVGRLALAVATRDVPLDLTVNLTGTNPDSNSVTARLGALDWDYLVDGKKTVSGKFTEPREFPPGQIVPLGVQVTFNLADVVQGGGRDLLETALALSGQRQSKHTVTMELRPLIDTPVGRMRYPSPIQLVLTAPAQP